MVLPLVGANCLQPLFLRWLLFGVATIRIAPLVICLLQPALATGPGKS